MHSKPIYVPEAGLTGVGITTHFARYGRDAWLYDTDSSQIVGISRVADGTLDELVATG